MRVSSAMAFFDGGFGRQLHLGRDVEIACDVAFQGRLVAFQPQEIIGSVRHVLLGDGGLAAHGVDRDQRAFELFGLGELISRSGMAVISLVFSGTESCASVRRALVA